jgi:hypothetical protein
MSSHGGIVCEGADRAREFAFFLGRSKMPGARNEHALRGFATKPEGISVRTTKLLVVFLPVTLLIACR